MNGRVSTPVPLDRKQNARRSYLVTVPVFDHLVLSDGPEEVAAGLESDLHDALVVREEGPVAVAKVETPDLDVLVRRAGHDQLRVGRDVECEDRKLSRGGSVVSDRMRNGPGARPAGRTYLVTVQRQEELERVGVKDLDRRVEQRDGQQPTVRAILDSENIVRHLERLDMRERQHARRRATLDLGRDLADFKIPKLDVLVGRTGHETSLVGTDVERPQRAGVGGESLEEGRGGQIVEQEFARFGTDHDLQRRR